MSRKVDFVASTALDGAFRIFFATRKKPDKNEVTISFSPSSAGAEAIANAYRRFHGRNMGIADILRPERNAVLLWALHPSRDDQALVKGCLR